MRKVRKKRGEAVRRAHRTAQSRMRVYPVRSSQCSAPRVQLASSEAHKFDLETLGERASRTCERLTRPAECATLSYRRSRHLIVRSCVPRVSRPRPVRSESQTITRLRVLIQQPHTMLRVLPTSLPLRLCHRCKKLLTFSTSLAKTSVRN